VGLMSPTTFDGLDALRETVAAADAVVPVGGRTQWEVGNPPRPDAVAVSAPEGVVEYDPADLTVTVAAGTRVADLAACLADAGQECALDPQPGDATVGGVLAAGLSGHRRLRYGPLRDRVLEVRFVTGDGRVVKAGGPTVKNVSGFDLPRLLVGSLGTIGVIVQVTLRCQPVAAVAEWCVTDLDPFELRRRMYRPSCLAWNGTTTHVLLEGDAVDVAAERRVIGRAAASDDGLPWPRGPHRGRISVRPSAVRALATALDSVGVHWSAEVGVGTVHVATEREVDLARARQAATAQGGWLLREAGAPGLDGFGRDLPHHKLMERVRAAFDPVRKLSPGRLPEPTAEPDPLVDGEG
jgi:glycolate dehydrogenase FAD-binding subunit